MKVAGFHGPLGLGKDRVQVRALFVTQRNLAHALRRRGWVGTQNCLPRALPLTRAPRKTSPSVWKTPLLSTRTDPRQGTGGMSHPAQCASASAVRSRAASVGAEPEGGRFNSRGGGPLRDFLWSLPGRARVRHPHACSHEELLG